MNYDIAYISNKGGKALNEDRVLIKHLPDCAGMVVCVADGLGSHGGGDLASGAVVEVLEKAFSGGGSGGGYSDEPFIERCFVDANNAIVAQQTPTMPMKSTAVLLAIEKAESGIVAKLAHVGDTRGYMFSNGVLAVQTLDHSIPQMDVFRGNITPDEIRFHPGRNQILRALGVDGKPEFTPLPPLQLPLQPGTGFLLCSDGFWEYVTEAEMQLDLSKSETAEKWLSYMIARLSGRVPPDHDNISVVAVLLK